MTLTPYERETIILFNEEDDTASVYTHNPKLIRKLKKLSAKYPDKIYEVKSGNITGNGSVNYIVPKACVSVREPFSEKRRKTAREIAIKGNYRPPKRSKPSEI